MPPKPRSSETPDETPAETPVETPTSDTPIHDQLVEDLKNADPEDVTGFGAEEDDDPLSHVGDFDNADDLEGESD